MGNGPTELRSTRCLAQKSLRSSFLLAKMVSRMQKCVEVLHILCTPAVLGRPTGSVIALEFALSTTSTSVAHSCWSLQVYTLLPTRMKGLSLMFSWEAACTCRQSLSKTFLLDISYWLATNCKDVYCTIVWKLVGRDFEVDRCKTLVKRGSRYNNHQWQSWFRKEDFWHVISYVVNFVLYKGVLFIVVSCMDSQKYIWRWAEFK